MSFPHWFQPLRRASLCATVLLFASYVASAQSAQSQNQSSAASYSSSQAGLSASGLQLSEFSLSESPTPGASALGGGSGQYGDSGGYGGGGKHAFLHNWTFEAGGGFNAPVGNDTGDAGDPVPVITWGSNFTVGAGLRFSNRISALLEYQFMGDKLPAAFLAEFPPEDQITAGNAHINSITGSPVIDLFPKKSNGVYLVGGFGYYHKSTNLQTPELTFDYYGDEYYENVTVASFTSNQWGGNAGLGFYHRLGGGMYGSDSGHTEIFAEARYTFIHTPAVTQTNGLGTTELIPVTLGVRF